MRTFWAIKRTKTVPGAMYDSRNVVLPPYAIVVAMGTTGVVV
jgi:hypothetical protein